MVRQDRWCEVVRAVASRGLETPSAGDEVIRERQSLPSVQRMLQTEPEADSWKNDFSRGKPECQRGPGSHLLSPPLIATEPHFLSPHSEVGGLT